MNTRKSLLALGGGLVIGFAGAAHAEPATDSKIAALEARIAELEGRQTDNWLNERRAEEVKALVHEVLSDAETRASLQGGAIAGHNGKFFLASEDGNFHANIGGQVQVRYIFNSRDEAANGGPAPFNDNVSGFTLRRTKVYIDGHVINPDWTYKVQVAANRSTNAVGLEEAWIGYQIADGLKAQVGRFKAPFLREELVSSSRQLAVERSLVNEFFTVGFVEGLQVSYEATDNVRLAGMIHDGTGSGEIGVANDFHQDNNDISFAARADVLVAGNWRQASDFSSWSGEDLGVFIGGGINYDIEETGNTNPGNTNSRVFSATVDAQVENNGFSAFGAVIYRNTDKLPNNVDQWGVVLQGAYNINDRIEPFVRYEYINPDTNFAGPDTGHEIHIITAGANYYIAKHNAKVSLDLVWALKSLDEIGGSTGLGLLTDNRNDADQIAVRAQVQLLF
jgi:hypothetical protein